MLEDEPRTRPEVVDRSTFDEHLEVLRDEPSGGRPTAQWPRIDAGRSDDLGTTGAPAAPPPDNCH